MSNPAKPTWKEKIIIDLDNPDRAIWLYEHTQEWYLQADADEVIRLRYLSSKPMPMKEQPGQAPPQGGKQ